MSQDNIWDVNFDTAEGPGSGEPNNKPYSAESMERLDQFADFLGKMGGFMRTISQMETLQKRDSSLAFSNLLLNAMLGDLATLVTARLSGNAGVKEFHDYLSKLPGMEGWDGKVYGRTDKTRGKSKDDTRKDGESASDYFLRKMKERGGGS